MMTVLSVRLSDCLSVPDHKSRTEGHSKLKIGRREAHDAVTCEPFGGQRVKGDGHQAD